MGEVDDIGKMFDRFVEGKEHGEERVAIALIEDGDGDYAIARVSTEGGGEVRVLGWIQGEDNACEFSAILEMMAAGRCEARIGGSDEIDDILRRGLQNGL